MADSATLQQRIEELEGLNRLAQALSSTLEVDEILKSIIDTSLSLCKAQRGAILLIDPVSRSTVKTLVHKSSDGNDSIEHSVNLTVAGWVIDHKTPLFAENYTEGVGIKVPVSRMNSYGSVIGMPLSVQGDIIGVLNLLNDHGGLIFTDDALRIATIIAQQSAHFLHTAKLHEHLFEENIQLKKELIDKHKVHGIIGESQQLKQILDKVPTIARSKATVLINGETGTGKELIARAIHFESDRATKPFIPINCAAIPPNLVESELFGHERGAFTGAVSRVIGKFELASGGTIFLDEISEMPLDIQPKFLRVLEERRFFRVGSSSEIPVDVRVVAASSKELGQAVKEGRFRVELYYRLNVIPITLPPLRERKEDIPTLARHFLEEFSDRKKKFNESAIRLLQQHEWIGNIRELRNVVERIAILAESNEITADSIRDIGVFQHNLPPSPTELHSIFRSILNSNTEGKDLLDELEKEVLQIALQLSEGNMSQAARLLGVDRKVVERRCGKFSL